MKKAVAESKIKYLENPEVECLKAVQFKNGNVVVDVKINDVIIYGVAIVEGKRGDFLSFPQRAGKDGKYYSIVWCPLKDEDQAKIIAQAEEILTSK